MGILANYLTRGFLDLICVKMGRTHSGILAGSANRRNSAITRQKDGVPMNEAKRLSELAQCCRRIADDQQDPDVLDMLHDLEQAFIQKAKAAERINRHRLFTWNRSDITTARHAG
jgi:hypothetical protein